MSTQEEQSRQYDWVLPMTVDSTGKAKAAVLAVTTVVATVDLSTIPANPGLVQDPQKNDATSLGHYLTVEVEAGDTYLLFGPTLASVTGANAPVVATVGTNVVGLCQYVPAGQKLQIKLFKSSATQFMSYLTKTGTATIRVYPSSI